jgi:hypothetical protein
MGPARQPSREEGRREGNVRLCSLARLCRGAGPNDLASSRSSKPACQTERERELCLLFFLNLKFSLKTILKQFDLGAKTNQHDKSKCTGMYASTCF